METVTRLPSFRWSGSSLRLIKDQSTLFRSLNLDETFVLFRLFSMFIYYIILQREKSLFWVVVKKSTYITLFYKLTVSRVSFQDSMRSMIKYN